MKGDPHVTLSLVYQLDKIALDQNYLGPIVPVHFHLRGGYGLL